MVRERGLEPPSLAALAPHASVYTIPPLARGVVFNLVTLTYLAPLAKHVGGVEREDTEEHNKGPQKHYINRVVDVVWSAPKA